MYQPETNDNIYNIRQDVRIKKEMLKHVSHERSILMQQCRSRGRITRYNAVLVDNSNPINHGIPMLHKFCTHHPDMYMTSHLGSFTLHVNNEPFLVIKKKKQWKQKGVRWIIEQCVQPTRKHAAKFQHGYIYVLRVPMMPVRMGVFFKAPIHQDFTNFNGHYRTNDKNDIIEYSVNFPIMEKPQYGSNYVKLSNNFDLSKVFNDVHIKRSIRELQVRHGSKKNFTIYQLHSIYSPRTQLLPDTVPSLESSTVPSSPERCREQCRELKDTDATLNGLFYDDEQSDTNNVSHDVSHDVSATSPAEVTDGLTKYISMTRYDKHFYLTTFNAPVTPAIAFIASVLACT